MVAPQQASSAPRGKVATAALWLSYWHSSYVAVSKMKKFMDPLAGDSDSETSASGSGSGSDSDSGNEQEAKKLRSAAQPDVDPEALVSGTSVLFVPEPKAGGEQDWQWGSGTAHREAGGDEATVTREGREATREAVGSGLEQSVDLAFRTAQRQAELREAKRQEAAAKATERRMTFQQREKRKREQGQAKGGGKNFVEEEKRLARNHGVYSGFDN